MTSATGDVADDHRMLTLIGEPYLSGKIAAALRLTGGMRIDPMLHSQL